MAGADRSSRAASAWRRMLERSGGRHRPGCHTWWALRRACAAASPSHGWRRGLDFQVAAHGAAAASCSDRPSGRHDRARSWPPLRQSFPTGSSSGPGARAAARAAGRGVRPARRSGRPVCARLLERSYGATALACRLRRQGWGAGSKRTDVTSSVPSDRPAALGNRGLDQLVTVATWASPVCSMRTENMSG